jgi:hypothetical protein
MDWLKTIVLFFYGTTPAAISHHTPQARMIAYTLGGIILFVTVPFVFAGVTFLSSTHITSDILQGALRWIAIVALASLLTLSIIWLERALVILGDAVAQHWLAQAGLLAIRLLMIALLSVVIAQKWEEASHQGLIRAERQVMRDEAVTQHRQHSNQEFDLAGLSTREASSQTAINSIETRLATLPTDLAQAQSTVQTCLLEARRLWAEYSGARADENESESHRAYLANLRTRAGVKSSECKQLDSNTRQRIETYKAPLRTQLNQYNEEHAQLISDQRKAIQDASSSYKERVTETELALTEAGTDAKAFARVREKNSEIDQAVKAKTILLAAIEMLPLILKLLLWNSPVSAETRATLQAYSAWYREQMRKSIQNERPKVGNNGSSAIGPHSPAWAPHAMVGASPYRAPLPAAQQAFAQLDPQGYWVGYPN